MSSESGEDTLRLIAGLPAPAGLEERVHKALRAAPRSARVLAWPSVVRMENHWMRAAAAAAIVFVIVGGGWGIYSRVQPGPAGKVIEMPQRGPSSGGFGGAGAIRTPETLPGPKVRVQENRGPKDQETLPAKKPAAPKRIQNAQPAHRAAPQPGASH